jgi:hypothetical protein
MSGGPASSPAALAARALLCRAVTAARMSSVAIDFFWRGATGASHEVLDQLVDAGVGVAAHLVDLAERR